MFGTLFGTHVYGYMNIWICGCGYMDMYAEILIYGYMDVYIYIYICIYMYIGGDDWRDTQGYWG